MVQNNFVGLPRFIESIEIKIGLAFPIIGVGNEATLSVDTQILIELGDGALEVAINYRVISHLVKLLLA